jgi:ornithine cyclodeaminase/alanine dehydrogenase-like protein (mu-crystallin family)
VAGPYREAHEVEAALRLADARPYLRTVLQRYETGRVELAPRGAVGLAADGSVTHVMVARDLDEQLVATKVLDYDPGRPRRDGRATAAGIVALLRDGRPLLISPGDGFTGIRTGLTAAFAVDGLAVPGPLVVALVGPGLVGQESLRALRRLRTLGDVRIVGSTPQRAGEAASALTAELEIPVRPMSSVRQACEGADVLITATSVVEPIVDAADLPPSVRLVAALGAGISERRELTAAAVGACDAVVVDTLEGAAVEAGDLVQAAAEGVETEPRPLGAALDDRPTSGRTLYKSVGSPWQDLACLLAVLDRIEPGWADTGGSALAAAPR